MEHTKENETQYQDVGNVLAGKHNFAIIELRKAPRTYNWLDLPAVVENILSKGFEIHTRYGSEGYETVVSRPGFFDAYLDLLHNRHNYSRTEYHIAFGTLLGYAEEDVKAFADNPPDCECSKCGGPYADSYKIIRDEYGNQKGKLYDVNPRAVRNNPAIQTWSQS